jgi:hypothetical protein
MKWRWVVWEQDRREAYGGDLASGVVEAATLDEAPEVAKDLTDEKEYRETIPDALYL